MATHMNSSTLSVNVLQDEQKLQESQNVVQQKAVVEVTKAEDFFLKSSKTVLGKRASYQTALNPEVPTTQQARPDSDNDIAEEDKTKLADT